MTRTSFKLQGTDIKQQRLVLWLVLAVCLFPPSLVLLGCMLGEAEIPNPVPGLATEQLVGLVALVSAPIPHTLYGREQCFTCHAIGTVDAPSFPTDHEEDGELCTACHAEWLAQAVNTVAVPTIPHD